jgi:hypothetical protein
MNGKRQKRIKGISAMIVRSIRSWPLNEHLDAVFFSFK